MAMIDIKRTISATAFVALLGVAGAFDSARSEEGIANYYSDKFHGTKTASGEVYDKNGMTAAHKKHPYGTKLRVTNLENNKSAVVTVNDRMRTKNPVVVDVTHKAAQELGFAKSGKARVKVDVLQ
jgi:rare lipoprotein A